MEIAWVTEKDAPSGKSLVILEYGLIKRIPLIEISREQVREINKTGSVQVGDARRV